MITAQNISSQRAPGFGLANARFLLLQAQSCGISDQQMLAKTGLTRPQIDLGLADVSIDQELSMIDALLLNSASEPLAQGFATGLRYRLASLGVLGMAMASSRDARAALDMIRRYLACADNLTQIHIHISRDELRLEFRCRHRLSEARERFVTGREFGILAALQGELLAGGARNVRALSLVYPRLPVMAEMEKVFGCALQASAAGNVFCGDASQLLLTMPLQNPVAANACESLCTGESSVADEERTSHKVQRLVARTLPDVPDMAAVAAELCMSPRTLGRRLEEDGWCWRDLLCECRLRRAEELLRSGVSIKVTAMKAGFSSASAFSHAFQRGRGMSPRRFFSNTGAAIHKQN